MTRDDALALDAKDPLAPFRARFHIPQGVIYLDGNSLGPMPVATKDRLVHVIGEEWGNGLIRSWNDAGWIDAPKRIGAKIAPLIGARPEEVLVADSTSVNIYKLVMAGLALNPERNVVVTEKGNFPTDHYMLQGLEREGDCTLRAVDRGAIEDALDEGVALLVLTHVH